MSILPSTLAAASIIRRRSSQVSNVADGTAIALYPAESIARQSLTPSAMHRWSPGASCASWGALKMMVRAPFGNWNRGFFSQPR